MIEQKNVYGSFVGYVKTVHWSIERNQREAESIARSVDAALDEGYSQDSISLEIQLRRLAGVQLADQFGDWSACTATEWIPTGQSLIPRDHLKQTLKDAAVMKKLMEGVGRGNSASRSKNVRRSGASTTDKQPTYGSASGQSQFSAPRAPLPHNKSGAAQPK
jgi:hypothetical protein